MRFFVGDLMRDECRAGAAATVLTSVLCRLVMFDVLADIRYPPYVTERAKRGRTALNGVWMRVGGVRLLTVR